MASAALSAVLVAGLMPLPFSPINAFADEGAAMQQGASDASASGAQLERAGDVKTSVEAEADGQSGVAASSPAASSDSAASGASVDAGGGSAAPISVSDEEATQVGSTTAANGASEKPAASETTHDDATASGASESAREDGTASKNATGGQAGEAESASSGSAALDPANLADGTYTVAVALRNIGSIENASMAASAIDNTDELVVRDGAYTLKLKLGTVNLGTLVGTVERVDYYPDYSISGSRLAVSGAGVQAWTAASNAGAPASIPVSEQARSHGYLALALYSPEMPVSPQDAALKIDWSTLAKVSDEAPASEPAQGAGGSDTPGDSQPGQQAGDNANTSEQSARESREIPAATSDDAKTFVAGHVYSVPVYFTKTGTAETSMAAQYFGGTAYVRPQQDGSLNVRFSTNRPDYVESVSYNGVQAAVTASSDSSREFSITIPKATSNTVVALDFVITPMKELGAGSVSADMHLYLSQAQDLGGDSGQVSSASGGGSSLPSTGDSNDVAGAGLLALAGIGAATAVYARRKLEEEA